MARDSKIKLPHRGKFHFAKNRKFEETIIFVPFFGGSPKQMARHVRFVNKLGYDAVTLKLSFNQRIVLSRLPWSLRTRQWGLKHKWADEIEDILMLVDGPKIVYAFSNPSSCAIEALARDPQHYEVKALICDSGPFVDIHTCNWNLLTYEYKLKNLIWKAYLTILFAGFWSYAHEKTLSGAFKKLKADFPVLSIRGWADNLVPLKAIEKAFVGHDHLHLEVLNLPEGNHLNGLKDFKEEYVPRVQDFLRQHSHAL